MVFGSNHVDFHMIPQRHEAISLEYRICYSDFEDKEMRRIHSENTSPPFSAISGICKKYNQNGRKISCSPAIRITVEFKRSRASDATRRQLNRYSEWTQPKCSSGLQVRSDHIYQFGKNLLENRGHLE